MTFTQLEIFVMVAEMRGFTLAALRLGISQSAVSQRAQAAGIVEAERAARLLARMIDEALDHEEDR